MSTWAIGDVHGCHRTLRALMTRLPFDPATDHLWLVGDLVNRGPDSLGVLRWARRLAGELGERMVVVLGNHDVHLLALAAGLEPTHRRRDLETVLEATDADELIAWLLRRPLLHRRQLGGGGEHLLIHAGLLPGWSAGVAEERARRAEAILRRPGGLESLVAAGPGGQETPEESETLAVLTRLRMLDDSGRPCAHTGAPEEAPPGCVAWFDAPGRATLDAVVVAGHWAALGHRLRPDLIALDSGCVYGGALTAIRLEDRCVLQEPSREG